MNYLSLKKYNLYSLRRKSLWYFDVKTAEDVPVISGKNPSGINGLPTGKSYTATQFKYFLILFCSSINLLSSFVWGSFFIGLMTKFTNNWGFQHLLDRPTSSDTIFKKSTLKSFFSRPLSKWFGFALVSKQMIIRTVKVLFSESVPNAVIFGIIILGVYSVNGSITLAILFTMGLITLIHIIKEILKNQPFFTNNNSSPTIILETIIFRIKTTLLHSTPYLVKPSSALSVFHNYSIANNNMVVNQFYTPMWITKSQLTDFYNKAVGKPSLKINK